MKTYITKSLLTVFAALLMGSAFAQTCNINQQAVSYSGPTSGCGAINGVVNTSSSQIGVVYTLYGNGNSHIGTSKIGTGGPLYFPTGNINQSTTFKVYTQIDTTKKSLSFLGTGFSHVNIGTALNSLFDNTNLITVEAWVYPTSGYGLRTVVSNYEGSSMQYLLRIQNLQPSFYVGTGTGGTNFVYALSPNTIPLNTWTHIAGTWDGTSLKIYVNGIQEATTSATGNFGSVSNNLKIGGGLNNGTEDFSGNITDVRIWNNTRTQSDINTNKDKCINVASPGLLAYYKMSDALGSSTLTDSTGHGYNGALTNMNSNTAWQQNTPIFLCGCTLLMTQQPSVTITAPAITGDLNCNGSISNGEVSGDSNYNGVIDNGEIAGDINGNGSIDFGEIFGDTNGNGIIDSGETNTIVVSGFTGTSVHLNGAYNFDGIVNGKPSYFKLPMAGGDCSSLGNEYACNFDLLTWIKWDNTKWRFYGYTQCQWEAAFGECVPAAIGVSGIQAYIDSLANINNTTNSYYAPCNGWNYSGFFGTPIISGDCGCGLAMQTVTGSATICYGANLPITVNSTETGVVYYLRKNPYHIIVAGPIVGTGNAITFNTGFNSNVTTTYNVYAHSASDSANCHVRMNDLVTIVVNQPTVVGDANCNGFIDNSEISGDSNYNGVIDGSEVAGDINGNGTIGAGEVAGDINGNGTIGVGETAGDINGNGTIGAGETAGDINGNGTIGAGETAGDINGNGTIGAGETAGDINGNGTIGAGETAGDINGNGTIGAGETAGDINGNGTIGAGETAGDTNGNGTIGSGETAGDINGNGTIGAGETAGDINGNGTIGAGETAGDINGNGTIGAGETAGDVNGNGTIGVGETAGDINGNGTISAGETAGDTNGNGTIGAGEVAGDTNGSGTIGAGETAGDINGNGTIGAGEVAGDTNGSGTIGAGETAGDINGNGTIGSGEIAGDNNGNGTIASGETAGDANGDGTIGSGEVIGDINGDGTIGSGETFGDTNGNGTIDSGETVGIAKNNVSDDIKIYPNPSSGIFVVEGFSKGVKFDVVNTVGEIVMSITVTNTKTKIDLSNKANGVYFINSINGYTHKLVKQD